MVCTHFLSLIFSYIKVDPVPCEFIFHFYKGRGELHFGLPPSSSHANCPIPSYFLAVDDPHRHPACRNPEIRSSPWVQITSKHQEHQLSFPRSKFHYSVTTTASLQVELHLSGKKMPVSSPLSYRSSDSKSESSGTPSLHLWRLNLEHWTYFIIFFT